MGGKTKKGKGRLDKYYHLAKEQGFRSRAAFKLIQLNRKYNFLGSARALLDLCAAPGGWMQVAANTMPMGSLILGVDLVPIKPIRGARSIIGDITTQATRAALRREANGSLFDVVVHDGAPNVGGAWANEAYTQSSLVLDSLKLATEFLVPKGTFVTKIFRSKDYNALLYAFNQLFDKVDATKPSASRNTSAEIFVVCLGYKAPARIDPRLLDAKHLFQEVTDAPKVMGPDALLRDKAKARRHRGGYDDGLSTTHRTIPALAFLASPAPVELLGKVTRMALDGPDSWQPVEGIQAADLKELAAKVGAHPTSTPEIRQLCGDLQVLGRAEFKALLRWRTGICKALADDLAAAGVEGVASLLGRKRKPAAAAGAAADGDAAADAPSDPEAALLAEMAEAREAAARRDKKEKKKTREAKKKARIRAAQLGATQGMVDDAGPDELFSLAAVQGGDHTLTRLTAVAAPHEGQLEALEAPDSSDDEAPGPGAPATCGAGAGGSDDDDALRYEMELEAALEESYRGYLERKGHRDDVRKEKRRRLGMDMELDEGEEEGAAGGEEEHGSDDDDDEGVGSGGSGSEGADVASDEDQPDPGLLAPARGGQRKQAAPGAGLLVKLDERRAGVATTAPAMAAQWFGQDLFDDPNLIDAGDEEDEEDTEAGHVQQKGPQAKQDQGKAVTKQRHTRSDAAPATNPGALPPKSAAPKANGKVAAAQPQPSPSDSEEEDAGPGARGGKADLGFEVVPASKKGSAATAGRAAGGRDDQGGGDGGSSDSGTDSEDEFDLLDDQGKAEVLALAKRMLRRKDKESIVDAAYNRYAFHDTGLPRWFVEDERHHMRPILPVTKEEVEAEKLRLRAVDARPIKKVAEAKGRAKRRVQAKLQAAREKAESIAAQEDVPLKSKMREIEKLYARARVSGKKGKQGDKGKKGGKGGKDGKRRGPPKDKRMIKDLRAQKRIDKAKKGGRKGGKGRGGRK